MSDVQTVIRQSALLFKRERLKVRTHCSLVTQGLGTVLLSEAEWEYAFIDSFILTQAAWPIMAHKDNRQITIDNKRKTNVHNNDTDTHTHTPV